MTFFFFKLCLRCSEGISNHSNTTVPLFLLGALRERLHVKLGQVSAVLVPAQVPLYKDMSHVLLRGT